MKTFVVVGLINYEPSTVLAAFTSREKADAYVTEQQAAPHPFDDYYVKELEVQ